MDLLNSSIAEEQITKDATKVKRCGHRGGNSCRDMSVSNNIKTQMFTGRERINPGVLQQIVIKLE